jgi:hypothetical protein
MHRARFEARSNDDNAGFVLSLRPKPVPSPLHLRRDPTWFGEVRGGDVRGELLQQRFRINGVASNKAATSAS